MINAENSIAWKYGVKVLYPQQAGLVLTTASQGAGGQLAATDPAASELTTLTMATGDELYWWLNVNDLWDCDFTRDIQGRVIWAADTAADSGILWQLDIKGFASAVAITDTKVTPDGTVSFASATAATIDGMQPTEWAGLGVSGELGSDLLLGVAATLANSGTASADEIHLQSIELRYTRSTLSSDGERQLT